MTPDIFQMDLEDRPLLHFADLTLALLRAASDDAATIADVAELLRRDLERAQELPMPGEREIAVHLHRAQRHLVAARLLEMLPGERVRITPRGRDALRRHPDGIDDSVLMEFDEFRSWMEGLFAHSPPEDARRREFLFGWNAQSEGAELTDNPFASDTAQHASWEDGWLEAKHHGRE